MKDRYILLLLCFLAVDSYAGEVVDFKAVYDNLVQQNPDKAVDIYRLYTETNEIDRYVKGWQEQKQKDTNFVPNEQLILDFVFEKNKPLDIKFTRALELSMLSCHFNFQAKMLTGGPFYEGYQPQNAWIFLFCITTQKVYKEILTTDTDQTSFVDIFSDLRPDEHYHAFRKEHRYPPKDFSYLLRIWNYLDGLAKKATEEAKLKKIEYLMFAVVGYFFVGAPVLSDMYNEFLQKSNMKDKYKDFAKAIMKTNKMEEDPDLLTWINEFIEYYPTHQPPVAHKAKEEARLRRNKYLLWGGGMLTVVLLGLFIQYRHKFLKK